MAWAAYSKQPNKERLRMVARELDPLVQKLVQTYAGNQAPPTVVDRARVMAIDAIKNYKPQPGKSIKAYLTASLRGIRRDAPNIANPFVAGQDARQQNAEMLSAVEDLRNELGREPSDEEVQSKLGLSLRQVVKIRRRLRANVPLSMWESKFDDEEGEGSDIATQTRSPYDDWMDAVYYDLGQRDRLIMQYRSGYRKSPVLSNAEIAKQLGMSPGQVSERAAVIQSRLDEFHG